MLLHSQSQPYLSVATKNPDVSISIPLKDKYNARNGSLRDGPLFDKIDEIPVSSSVTRLTHTKQRLQHSQSQPHISSVPPCLPRREASPTRGVFNGALFSGIIKTIQ